jgi:hypothetical protein
MPALAKTTARCGAAMSGIARSSFAPRHTTRHVPGTVLYVSSHVPARYYVYGATVLPVAQNEIQVVVP